MSWKSRGWLMSDAAMPPLMSAATRSPVLPIWTKS